MAITKAKTLEIDALTQRDDGSRHGDVQYICHTDEFSATLEQALEHADIPEPHEDAHPHDPLVKCRNKKAEYLSDFRILVTATFDTRRETKDDEKDPLARLVKGGQRSYTELRPTWQDTFGNPLVNSAGDFYEGIQRRHRMREFSITANFDSIPSWLFRLSGTLNLNAVTIHGDTFPPLTCLLAEADHPDEPEVGPDDTEYWPIRYSVIVDPDGWQLILPNRGYHRLAYDTSDGSKWTEDVGFDAYDAEADPLKKRIRKLRVTDDADQDIAADQWLNDHGEIETVLDLTGSTVSGSMAKDSNALTGAGLTDDHKGKSVVVEGAGSFGRPLRAKILNVVSGTGTLSRVADTAVTSATCHLSGAFINAFTIDELADWTDIPMPNNGPPIS